MGFKLVGDLKKQISGCENFSRPLIMSTFILSSFNEEDLVLKMNDCQRDLAKNNPENKFFLNYGTVRFSINNEEKEVIEKTWAQMKDHYEMYNSILKLDLENEKKKNLTHLNKKLNLYMKYDNFVGNLMVVFYAQIIKNSGLQERMLSEINKRPLLFEFLRNYYPYHDEISIVKKLTSVIEMIDNDIDKSNAYKLFKIKTSIESNKFFREQNKEIIDLPSFNRMNKMLNSPNYGADYLNVWLPWSLENFPKKRVDKIFEDYIPNSPWKEKYSLKFYYIENPSLRESTFKELNNLYSSNTLEKKVLFFELLSNESWKNYFNDKIKKFSIKSIKEKRKLLQGLLSESIAIDYAIFNLFKLGDFSRKYFIKLLAQKSYGISTTSILPLQ